MYKNSDIKSIEYLNNTFTIYGRVTDGCNYHCPYCINQNTRKNQFTYLSENKLFDMIVAINKFINNNNLKNISLVLSGGEVSFYNGPILLDKLTNIKSITLTSNFSAPLHKYKQLYIYCDSKNINLNLILSLHEENVDFNIKIKFLTDWCKDNNYKEPQVSLLVNNNFNFDIVENYIKNNIYNIKLVREKSPIDNSLVTLNEKINLKLEEYSKKLNKTRKSYRITFKDNTEIYVNSINDFLLNLDNKGFIPNGYFCNSGSKKVGINQNGDIYKNRCLKAENYFLGNIIRDDIMLDFSLEYCDISDVKSAARCGICGGISLYKVNECD